MEDSTVFCHFKNQRISAHCTKSNTPIWEHHVTWHGCDHVLAWFGHIGRNRTCHVRLVFRPISLFKACLIKDRCSIIKSNVQICHITMQRCEALVQDVFLMVVPGVMKVMRLPEIHPSQRGEHFKAPC